VSREVLPGKSYPLGATWDRKGVNFAIYSEHASRMQLCLFDAPNSSGERERISLVEVTGHVWHAYLPGIGPGQLYGYRALGPYEPAEGLRFNPSKLLIDPYAKALVGRVDWKAPVFGYRLGHDDADLSLDKEDDSWGVPKGVVIDPSFDWERDTPPQVPWHKSIIYEVHVKGLTTYPQNCGVLTRAWPTPQR
jgi:isoamylase